MAARKVFVLSYLNGEQRREEKEFTDLDEAYFYRHGFRDGDDREGQPSAPKSGAGGITERTIAENGVVLEEKILAVFNG